MTNLDVWQGHEVLGNVNNKLVHESWSNVEPTHGVVYAVSKKKQFNYKYSLSPKSKPCEQFL